MIGHGPRLAVTAVAFALIACTRGDAGDPTVVRVDSAGVRIITSGAEDKPLPWRFEQAGVMLDSMGEPWLFNSLPPSHVMSDRGSRTYVLTSREGPIVRFDRQGRHDRSIGRKGSGPGEMQFAVSLGAQGDSIFVRDLSRDALIRWGPDLGAIEQIRLEGRLAQVEQIAFRTGGLWLERTELGSDGTRKLALFADTLGAPALHEVTTRTSMARIPCGNVNVSLSLPPFFAPEIRWVATGPRILVNAEPQYIIWLYEGPRLIASIRRSMGTRAPTAEDAERAMPQGLRVGTSSGTCSMPAADALEALGSAPLLPHVKDLRLLSDGTMWVQRTPTADAPLLVDVFGSDGAYLGTVHDMALPLGRLPNGELLIPVEDSLSGGFHLARKRAMSAP